MNDQQWWSDPGTTPPTGPSSPPPPLPPTTPLSGPPTTMAFPPGHGGAEGGWSDPESKPRRPGRWRTIAIGATIAGLVGVGGYFAADFLLGGGGADSPTAAVEQLVDSVDRADLIGIADILNPTEVPGLEDLATKVSTKHGELVTKSEDDGLGGLDLEVADLELDVQMESDRVARVTVANGEIQVRSAAAALPAAVTDRLDEEERQDLDSFSANIDDFEEEFDRDLFVMVVEEDGGWYVSPYLTAAEYLVEVYDLPSGDFDAYGAEPDTDKGAKDAVEAVEELADAVNSGDPDDVLAVLPSDTVKVASVYEDALSDYLEDQFSGGKYPQGIFDLKDVGSDTRELGDGSVMIDLDGARFQVATDWDREYVDDFREVEVDGTCFHETHEKCNESDGSEVDLLASRLGIETIGLVAREVDEGWKVDPVRSLMELGKAITDGLDAETWRAFTQDASIGEVAGTLTAGNAVDVEYDDAGFAVYELPTEAGVPFAVWLTDGEETTGEGGGVTLAGLPSRYGGLGLDTYGSEAELFVGTGSTVRIGVGGLMNDAGSHQLHVAAIPVTQLELDAQATGDFTAPLAMFKFSWPGGELGVRGETDNVDFIEVPGVDAGQLSRLEPDYYWYDGEELEAGEYYVAVSGSVGDSYDFRLTNQLRGFPDGTYQFTGSGSFSTTYSAKAGDDFLITATVGGDSSIEVTLYDEYGDEVDYDWATNSGNAFLSGSAYETTTFRIRVTQSNYYGSSNNPVSLRVTSE